VGGDTPQFKGFLALLVAINAPPGMLDIADPDSSPAVSGFNAYNELYQTPNPPGGRSGNSHLTRAAAKRASKDTHSSQNGARPGYTTFLSTLLQIVCPSSLESPIQFLTPLPNFADYPASKQIQISSRNLGMPQFTCFPSYAPASFSRAKFLNSPSSSSPFCPSDLSIRARFPFTGTPPPR
jgi:hypothetical protein